MPTICKNRIDSISYLPDGIILRILEASGQVENLLPLSKSLYDTLHELDQLVIATVLSEYPVLSDLKLTDERVQLYTMLKNRPWVQPKHVLGPYSMILPQSWKTADLAVRLINEKHPIHCFALACCFGTLTERLIKQERCEVLAYLLKKSGYALDNWANIWESEFVYRLGKRNPLVQLSLLLSGNRKSRRSLFSRILPMILFTPVKDGIDILNPLFSGLKSCINEQHYEWMLEAVIKSCKIELEAHSVEQCTLIHLRNVKLIERLESGISDDNRIQASIPFVRLLNDVRFGPSFISFQESEIKRCIQLRKENVRGERCDEGYALLYASMLAQRRVFFQETCVMISNPYYLALVMCALTRYPVFASSLSADFCEKMLGQGLMTLEMFNVMREAGRCPTVKEVQKIESVDQRLVILAKMGCSKKVFTAIKKGLAGSIDISSMMHALMSRPDSSLSCITILLEVCNRDYGGYTLGVYNWLGNEKFLRALVEFGDDSIFSALSDYEIILDTNSVRVLLNDGEFATAICTCRDGFIRSRLQLSLRDLFYDGLRYEKIMRLFAIFRVPLNEHSFSIQKIGDDFSRKLYDSCNNWVALEDIAEYAKTPGFLAHLTLVAYSRDCYNLYIEAEMNSAAPNLLQLRMSLCMFEKWRDTDLESFLRCAPNAVLRGFKLQERADRA